MSCFEGARRHLGGGAGAGLVRFIRGATVLGMALLLPGCGKWGPNFLEGGDIGSTTTTGEGGAGGDLFPTGGGGSGPVCEHSCVPYAPAWFEDLSMFWIGAPEKLPPCPEVAPLEGSMGFADLQVAPHTCPECECSPATCVLPELMYASAAKCPADGASMIDWNAPVAWEGVCSAEDPIAAGLSCEGVPCVQSLTVEAPAVEPCKPFEQGAASIPEPSWGLVARECNIGPLSGEGCGVGEACAPAPPEGFTLCVYRYGANPDLKCPAEYPRRLEVFSGVQDDRACDACDCGEPAGVECAAHVAAFSDAECGVPAGAVVVTGDEAACVDVPSGKALGSKSASFLVDQPGSCTPGGGAAMGAVVPAGPVTLCCLPEPDPAG